MSLATRLTALAQAVGADIKALNTKVNTAGDPTPQKRQSVSTAAQSGPGNNIAWVYNTAGAPYIDLTPGTWRIEGAALMTSNVGDFVVLGLYDETAAAGVAGSAGTASVVNPAGSPGGYGCPSTSHVLTVTTSHRYRLWVIPNGGSTQTVVAGPASSVPVAYMVAYKIAPGLAGPKGDKGDSGYSPMSAIGGGTSVNASAVSWLQLPCDSSPFLVVTTTDGTADFTRTAAGGLTFNKAGTYDVACTMGNKSAAQTVAGAMDLRLVIGAVGNAAPDQNEKQVAVERRQVPVGDYNIASLASTVTVAAGQTLAAWAFTPGATTGMGITAISISRSGGPQGIKGADGATAAFNVVDLVAANSYTIAGLDGDLDYGYEFILMGSIPAGSTVRTVTIVPNALVVPANAALKSYRTGFFRETNAMSADNLVADGIGFVICPAYTTTALATLNAQVTLVARTGSERVCKSSFETSDASTIYRILHGTAVSKWTDTTTKITSLRVLSDGAFTGKLLWRKIVM